MVADGTCEVVVYDPYTGEGRRRAVAYRDGLETPEWKGPNSVKYGITVDVPDPTWYGPVRNTVRALDGVRRPFLATPIGKDSTSGGTVVRRNLLPNPSFEVGVDQPGFPASSIAGNATTTTTTTWADSGQSSLMITSGNNMSSSLFLTGQPTASMETTFQTLGMAAGKTYTIAGTIRLVDTLTGTMHTQSRCISVRLRVNGASVDMISEPAPNAPGVYRLSKTFTVPAGATGASPVVWNGTTGGQVVYWDSITLEEGGTDGSYFDGDTPTDDEFTYEWEGVPHKSASVMKARQMYSPRFFPVILAQSTVEGAFTFDINGDAPTWPTWIVDGPGEDLLIENKKTGDRIFVSGRFDEQVTITTRPQVQDITSPSHMDGSLWDRVSIDSVLFPLSPGENEVAITMVGASAKTQVQMTYQEAWKAGY
jgi:hypothetical protein